MSDENSSAVIGQADALMHRHRRVFVAGAEAGQTENVAAENEDVPVLTDVVEADRLRANIALIAEDDIKARIHAAVGANDAELARALEHWIATQLPQVLSQALENVAEQLKLELSAKLRNELLTRPMFDQQPSKPAK